MGGCPAQYHLEPGYSGKEFKPIFRAIQARPTAVQLSSWGLTLALTVYYYCSSSSALLQQLFRMNHRCFSSDESNVECVHVIDIQHQLQIQQLKCASVVDRILSTEAVIQNTFGLLSTFDTAQNVNANLSSQNRAANLRAELLELMSQLHAIREESTFLQEKCDRFALTARRETQRADEAENRCREIHPLRTELLLVREELNSFQKAVIEDSKTLRLLAAENQELKQSNLQLRKRLGGLEAAQNLWEAERERLLENLICSVHELEHLHEAIVKSERNWVSSKTGNEVKMAELERQNCLMQSSLLLSQNDWGAQKDQLLELTTFAESRLTSLHGALENRSNEQGATLSAAEIERQSREVVRSAWVEERSQLQENMSIAAKSLDFLLPAMKHCEHEMGALCASKEKMSLGLVELQAQIERTQTLSENTANLSLKERNQLLEHLTLASSTLDTTLPLLNWVQKEGDIQFESLRTQISKVVEQLDSAEESIEVLQLENADLKEAALHDKSQRETEKNQLLEKVRELQAELERKKVESEKGLKLVEELREVEGLVLISLHFSQHFF